MIEEGDFCDHYLCIFQPYKFLFTGAHSSLTKIAYRVEEEAEDDFDDAQRECRVVVVLLL